MTIAHHSDHLIHPLATTFRICFVIAFRISGATHCRCGLIVGYRYAPPFSRPTHHSASRDECPFISRRPAGFRLQRQTILTPFPYSSPLRLTLPITAESVQVAHLLKGTKWELPPHPPSGKGPSSAVTCGKSLPIRHHRKLGHSQCIGRCGPQNLRQSGLPAFGPMRVPTSGNRLELPGKLMFGTSEPNGSFLDASTAMANIHSFHSLDPAL